ncbi:MAG: hypothetical protein HY722_12845 [Planctomycetes bacterium]|nr:hypothetical protein [Planctomycetota bacterium]
MTGSITSGIPADDADAAERVPELVEIPATSTSRDRAIEAFRQAFGRKPAGISSAPLPIQTFGDHSDCHDGLVLPLAANIRVWVSAGLRKDPRIAVHSADMDTRVDFSLARAPMTKTSEHWTDPIRTVLQELSMARTGTGGLDLCIAGDFSPGAAGGPHGPCTADDCGGRLGFGSALAVAVAGLAAVLWRLRVDGPGLARLCQRAENALGAGQRSITDAFVCRMARAGSATFLDCRTLEHSHVGMSLDGYRLVVCDTHGAGPLDGERRQRQSECDDALEILRARYRPDSRSLRDVPMEHMDRIEQLLPGVLFRRVRHVVTENARVVSARAALASGDLAAFGRLLDASHTSLRDDYQLACHELETIVAAAHRVDGVLGARRCGNGFSGCALALVPAGGMDLFRTRVTQAFEAATGRPPAFYSVQPAEGLTVGKP